MATVLPMLRWLYAARSARAGRLQTETTGPNRNNPPKVIHKRGERAAEVLCLYAALVDK